jgi:exopolyphosphatase/pppGpp-phosphohydrolase
MPGGIVVLRAVAERLGRPLAVARGGLREGVLLDLVAD